MSDYGNQLNIICLESEAFYALVEEVVDRLKEHRQDQPQDKWIADAEAMKLLGITSKTTLQKYRNEGYIRYTQPSKKVILYDRASIMEFLEYKAQDTF